MREQSKEFKRESRKELRGRIEERISKRFEQRIKQRIAERIKVSQYIRWEIAKASSMLLNTRQKEALNNVFPFQLEHKTG